MSGQNIPIHGHNHQRGASDETPGVGGIDYDILNSGDWLYIETTALGGPHNKGIDLDDTGGSGIRISSNDGLGGGDIDLLAANAIGLDAADTISLSATTAIQAVSDTISLSATTKLTGSADAVTLTGNGGLLDLMVGGGALLQEGSGLGLSLFGRGATTSFVQVAAGTGTLFPVVDVVLAAGAISTDITQAGIYSILEEASSIFEVRQQLSAGGYAPLLRIVPSPGPGFPPTLHIPIGATWVSDL